MDSTLQLSHRYEISVYPYDHWTFRRAKLENLKDLKNLKTCELGSLTKSDVITDPRFFSLQFQYNNTQVFYASFGQISTNLSSQFNFNLMPTYLKLFHVFFPTINNEYLNVSTRKKWLIFRCIDFFWYLN